MTDDETDEKTTEEIPTRHWRASSQEVYWLTQFSTTALLDIVHRDFLDDFSYGLNLNLHARAAAALCEVLLSWRGRMAAIDADEAILREAGALLCGMRGATAAFREEAERRQEEATVTSFVTSRDNAVRRVATDRVLACAARRRVAPVRRHTAGQVAMLDDASWNVVHSLSCAVAPDATAVYPAERIRNAFGNPFRPVVRPCRCDVCRNERLDGRYGVPTDGSRPACSAIYSASVPHRYEPGLDFRYLSRDVRDVATAIAEGGADGGGADGSADGDAALLVLADALQDAGCDDLRVLMPLRGYEPALIPGCRCGGAVRRPEDKRRMRACACGGRDVWGAEPMCPAVGRATHVFLCVCEAIAEADAAAADTLDAAAEEASAP